jgi:hypothetical protein
MISVIERSNQCWLLCEGVNRLDGRAINPLSGSRRSLNGLDMHFEEEKEVHPWRQ